MHHRVWCPCLALAVTALLAFSQAHAETVTGGPRTPTQYVGGQIVTTNGAEQSTFTFTPSPQAVALFGLISASPEAIPPAQLTGAPAAMALSAPVSQVGYSPLSDGYRLDGIATKGGIAWITDDLDFNSAAGSLTLSNFVIQPSERTIYADLEGANGVGFNEYVALWAYDPAQSNVSISVTPSLGNFDPQFNRVTLAGQINGLSLAPTARNMVGTSLGLSNVGYAALDATQNWGVITVPEPSSIALMGLGLVGLASVAHRRRKSVAKG